MAQQPDSKQQNQAFLQQMERQRLNKNCHQVIDLRGKVSGECQAYEFGNKVHYLDDRGYLLAKQLLTRFNGRYTVGVYETILKAIKQLNQNTSVTEIDEKHTAPPFFKLDRAIQRREQRVIFTTPVAIRLNDVLYNGHTIDIAATTLKISMKRGYSIELGDQVNVELVDYFEHESRPFLQKLPYLVSKIEHNQQNTVLILSLSEDCDELIRSWLHNWVALRAEDQTLDFDNVIDNQISDSYLQLWLERYSSCLIWLADTETTMIQRCHISAVAAQALEQIEQVQHKALLPTLTECLYNTDLQQDVLLVLSEKGAWSASCTQLTAIHQLLAWHQQQVGSKILLLKRHPVTVNIENHLATLSAIQSTDTDSADELKHTLSHLSQWITVHDVTLLCQNLPQTDQLTEQKMEPWERKAEEQVDIPHPKLLTPLIARSSERFYIHTPITATINDQQLELETQDVSTEGLAIRLPSNIKVVLNQRILIDFTRWQSLTKKVSLKQIPYQVKTKLYWSGEYRIGLKRIINNCAESQNVFFNSIIEKNRESLEANQQDIIDANESRIFIDLLKPTLNAIPVFIGADSQGQRRIKIIGDSQTNQAASLDNAFWFAFEQHLTQLSDSLKTQSSTVMYAYQDRQEKWHINFEASFSDARHKAMLLQRGLSASAFRCFQCRVTALSLQAGSREIALADIFLKWHSQRPHRVKQIHQQFAKLVAIIELNEMTDLVRKLFKH